jgi:hypothetical protein
LSFVAADPALPVDDRPGDGEQKQEHPAATRDHRHYPLIALAGQNGRDLASRVHDEFHMLALALVAAAYRVIVRAWHGRASGQFDVALPGVKEVGALKAVIWQNRRDLSPSVGKDDARHREEEKVGREEERHQRDQPDEVRALHLDQVGAG